MKEVPILITYESWANSQLSIAHHTGGMIINGKDYIIICENGNRYTPDLLRFDWEPVYRRLGREKTIGLIKNGTSLKVAKEMMKVNKEELPKLF